MTVVRELTPALGAGAACRALGLWRGAPLREQARHSLRFAPEKGGNGIRIPNIVFNRCRNEFRPGHRQSLLP